MSLQHVFFYWLTTWRRVQHTNSAFGDEQNLTFSLCLRNKQHCQTHWGFKSVPWHHVITVNITRHPGSCFKGPSGITGCSHKTISSHLNVPSFVLFEPLFTFLNLSHPLILPYLSLIHHSLHGLLSFIQLLSAVNGESMPSVTVCLFSSCF